MMPENILKKSHMRFCWLLGTLLLLIMVRYALQVDIPRVIFLIIIGLIVILGDRDEIIAMVVCCIPMHESIDFFFALAICAVGYVLKYHRTINIGINILLVLVIVIWELLHCFLTTFSIVDLLSKVIPIVILMLLLSSDTDGIDYPFVVRAFSWSTLCISITLLVRVFYFADFNFLVALAGLQRLGSDLHSNIQDVTVSGGQINPNSLGVITVLASVGMMQLRSLKVAKKSDMILMCAMIILAALGASRTYLACLALMIVLLIISEKGGLIKKLRLIGMLFLAIAVVVVALAIFFPETFEYFISRFLVDDITTGRDNLMMKYHNFITKNPRVMFFGIGLQGFSHRLINVYGAAQNTPHNFLQEIIVAWGFPGILLFIALYIAMYYASLKKNRNRMLLNWIPLIIILFKSMAGQLLTSSYSMLALSYAYLSLCQNFRQSSIDENSLFYSQPGSRE